MIYVAVSVATGAFLASQYASGKTTLLPSFHTFARRRNAL
jgi:hypothetical protein